MSLGLDLLEDLWPLIPVVHDDLGLSLLGEELSHLVHLLLAVLDVVDADVGYERDSGVHGSGSTRLAVFDGDALLWLHTKFLAGVEVDGRVWLGGWWVEGGGSGVDVLVLEEAY